MTQSIHKININ